MSIEKTSTLQNLLIYNSVQEFLTENHVFEAEAKFAWMEFSANTSDENIFAFLKSLHFIYDGIPAGFKKNPEKMIFLISLVLKEIIGTDFSIIEYINKIKQTLDQKSDDVKAIDSLLFSGLLKIQNEIKNEIIVPQARDLEKQINMQVHLMEIQIEDDIEDGILRESEIEKIMEKIQQGNLKFINSMKYELKKNQIESVKIKVDNKCNQIFEHLQVLSTRSFIHKAIDNIRKNGEALSAEAEKETDKEKKEELAKKAELNKELASDLQNKSNTFYSQPKVGSDKTKNFFADFDAEIEKNEKKLDIPREIWKPILINMGIALTVIGFLAIVGKASYAAYDHMVNPQSNASPFFFTHAKSYKIAEKARETAKALINEIPRFVMAI